MANTLIQNTLKTIKEQDIKFVDFRFTDYNGKWIHISHCACDITEEELKCGVAFDGSSVPAWKDINDSDMILMPDLDSQFIDPFNTISTLVLICDVIEPNTGQGYERDPRCTARLAEKYLKETGIGDAAYFGPEPEFFVFDDVRFQNDPNKSFFAIDSQEDPINNSRKYENNNMGHRSPVKGAYFDLAPQDSGRDLRSEITEILKEINISPVLHHHEVANSQFEIGFKYDSLTKTADNVQKFKYAVKNVSASYGKTATFMPKPIFGDNGSGMHVHQSIWKNGKPLFLGNKYAKLSQMALYYIGGIIKHAKALNAFTNPSTNSYKRLVPGFEAPILLAYCAKNRSAAIRIPHVTNDQAKRIETRFPDPAANPYLAFSAILMAGIDGILNKIDPGEAREENLYELRAKELKKVPKVASSLQEALKALRKDHKFLTAGGVFTDDQIDAYIKLKEIEVKAQEQTPSPMEFKMYYSC